MIKKEIDRKVEQYVEKLNKFLLFRQCIKRAGYSRIGLQVMKNNKPLCEYTSFNKNGRIFKIEKRIVNPSFVARVDMAVLKKVLQEKEMKRIKQHPFKAGFEYMDKIDVPLRVRLKMLSILLKE